MSGSFDSLFDFYCHNLVQEEARAALFGGICAGKYLHLSQSFAECMHPQPFNYSGPDSKLDMVRNFRCHILCSLLAFCVFQTLSDYSHVTNILFFFNLVKVSFFL